eukprot:g14893.t1
MSRRRGLDLFLSWLVGVMLGLALVLIIALIFVQLDSEPAEGAPAVCEQERVEHQLRKEYRDRIFRPTLDGFEPWPAEWLIYPRDPFWDDGRDRGPILLIDKDRFQRQIRYEETGQTRTVTEEVPCPTTTTTVSSSVPSSTTLPVVPPSSSSTIPTVPSSTLSPPPTAPDTSTSSVPTSTTPTPPGTGITSTTTTVAPPSSVPSPPPESPPSGPDLPVTGPSGPEPWQLGLIAGLLVIVGRVATLIIRTTRQENQ